MEGSGEIAAAAQKNFTQLETTNIDTIVGNFNNTLPLALTQLQPPIDFAFIDGNHRFEPTVGYFDAIVPKTINSSIVVLDDIRWSAEMEKAWNYCKDHSNVTLSIDLFFIGILIFRKEIKEKQHFTVRF